MQSLNSIMIQSSIQLAQFQLSYEQSIEMGIVNYCDYYALFAIALQFGSYANQFILQVVLLNPLWTGFRLQIIVLNVLALIAFYKANHIYKKYQDKDEHQSQYCKQCKRKIVARDHHCVFTGQCVDGTNFRYFLSYTLYSYTLSMLLLVRFILDWKTTIYVFYWGLVQYKAIFGYAILSGGYFAFMTGGLFAGSLRRILQGITKVDEIKDRRKPKWSQIEMLKKLFSPLATYREFKNNWKQINGNQFKIMHIIFPFL